MGALEATGANAEQIKYWNETAGPKWLRFHEQLDGQLRPIGRRAMDRGEIVGGERVIDVGCGCGETAIELAGRVGPKGSVLGIDLSRAMLDRAEALARAAGVENVRFENADAQTHRFPAAAFDVLYSRFGVMFFADPTAAFANLRTALRPGGRIALACWQSLRENSWAFVPLMAAAEHLKLPPPPPPDAPGPFSFADPNRVRSILEGAGFAAIELEELRMPLRLGGTTDLDEAVAFILEIGPTSRALSEADPALKPAVEEAVRRALDPVFSDRGGMMESAAWIVTARRS